MDVISRKQGMKGGSVLAHVTDWNDAADEESTPFCRAKRGSTPSGIPPVWGGFPQVSRVLVAELLKAQQALALNR
jgi:hypothetical protein